MVTSGVLVMLFCSFVAAKPQFLPVAVQLGKYSLSIVHVIKLTYLLDQPTYQLRTPYTLKTAVKVTDKDSDANRSVPYKLKATVKVRDDKENDIASEDIVVSSSGKCDLI